MISSKPSSKNNILVIPSETRNLSRMRELKQVQRSFANAQDDNKPPQYIKGWVEFYKLRFKVAPDVLIPRPETELLVDAVIQFVKEIAAVRQGGPRNDVIASEAKQSLAILDLGTGSGNIAISIAKNLKQLPTSDVGIRIIATDISRKALKVAKQNAKLHGVEDKITFLQSDLLNVIASKAKQSSSENNPTQIASSKTPRNDTHIDIIVTNLPYIPSARIPYLDPSVKDFEPKVALDGGEDGFELYRKLFQQINQLSTPGVDLNVHSRCVHWKPKLIIGEIDYTHGELAINEAQKYFPEAVSEVRKDLAHLQRILTIKHLID